MAIDVSSSMLAQDLNPNRLSALKRVASEFIDDRISDRIGLVVYAGESYTLTPITSDKKIIQNSLSMIDYESLIDDGIDPRLFLNECRESIFKYINEIINIKIENKNIHEGVFFNEFSINGRPTTIETSAFQNQTVNSRMFFTE